MNKIKRRKIDQIIITPSPKHLLRKELLDEISYRDKQILASILSSGDFIYDICDYNPLKIIPIIYPNSKSYIKNSRG